MDEWRADLVRRLVHRALVRFSAGLGYLLICCLLVVVGEIRLDNEGWTFGVIWLAVVIVLIIRLWRIMRLTACGPAEFDRRFRRLTRPRGMDPASRRFVTVFLSILVAASGVLLGIQIGSLAIPVLILAVCAWRLQVVFVLDPLLFEDHRSVPPPVGGPDG